MASDEQNQRIRDKCDRLHALLALNHCLNARELDVLERTRKLIEHGLQEELDFAEFTLDVNQQNAEMYAGYKGSQDAILQFGRSYRDQRFELLAVPKLIIDKFFSEYTKVFPQWKKIQPHALMHVDFRGIDQDIYLPEASLYEDMCLAFNSAAETKRGDTKFQYKQHVFFVRSTLISAYNFVECFLNGIAFDFVFAAERELLSRDRDLLTEWNSLQQRQRFVSFREKAVQYPKLVLGSKTPPFAESSCVPMKLLMEKIGMRDAIVHNSPKLNDAGDAMPKIRSMVELRFDDAALVADAAVAFVKLVDERVNQGKFDNAWILPRSSDGVFPAESFV
jgi:hypothetical protein